MNIQHLNKKLNKRSLTVIAILVSICYIPQVLAGPGHNHAEKPQQNERITQQNEITDEHSNALVLTDRQQQMAGIEVMSLSSSTFNLDDVATATLIVDRDHTVTLAPQLDVRVLKRHVVPGQLVKKIKFY